LSPFTPIVELKENPQNPVEELDLEDHDHDHDHEHVHLELPLGVRIANIVVIVVPFLGLITAIALLWGWGITWQHLVLMVGMYIITGMGITIGFHRYFTHKSFEAIPPVKWMLGIFGSMAVEGPLLKWVAQHRRHHQHSDRDDDPHSPHLHGHGFKGLVQGVWHSHMGWIFSPDSPGLSKYVSDLVADRSLRIISNLFPLWIVAGLILPTMIGGLATWSWKGALLGLLWGGLVRIFVVHHITWSINSVCHIWGTSPFRSHDHSKNNPIFGVLAFGEGWHNNHHAFPTSARHGLRWWEFDSSYIVIKIMEKMRLVSNVRVPTAQRMTEKLKTTRQVVTVDKIENKEESMNA